MKYFIYKLGQQGLHPQAGFEIGLGKGTNADGETWYLGGHSLSAEEAAQGLEAVGVTYKVIGGASDAEVSQAAPWIRDQKAAKIRALGAAKLNDLAGSYAPEERETWHVQKYEAREFLTKGAEASTPMLSAISEYRGVPLATLVELVMENVTLFEAASGAILGQQQSILTGVYTKPLAEAMALSWA